MNTVRHLDAKRLGFALLFITLAWPWRDLPAQSSAPVDLDIPAGPLDREHGVYYFTVKSSEDWGRSGGTSVLFDANTGALKRFDMPGTEASGDAVTRWLVWLHTARVFGLPMQIFVCIMGLIITALSVTGVVIWLRKRRSARHQRVRRAHTAPA